MKKKPLGGGGVGGHKFKSLGKLSNGYADWHRIWYMSAHSSGNEHRLNIIRPTKTQGHFGFFRGSQFQMFGEAVKWLDRLAPNLVQICGFVWNGHGLNTNRPSIPQAVLGGHKFNNLGTLSNNSTDWHQIWFTSADSPGSGHRLNTIRTSIY